MSRGARVCGITSDTTRRTLTIAGRRISDADPCYVIAELGGNHGGSVDTARQLVEAAVRAGADAVKFQKRENARLYTSALLDQPYENENSYGATYGLHREALELTPSQMAEAWLTADCDEQKIWFATAFDEWSADALEEQDVPAFKIHSGGLTDFPLMRHLAAFGKPVLLSTGGGTVADIDRAVECLGVCPRAILHCTASYPLQSAEANLRVIVTLRERYPDTVIGFSSHSPGIAFSLVAYALGARILEHHVTLSRASKGTDHAFSLEPKGLQTLIDDLEKVRQALGDGEKRFYESERKPIAKMRRVDTPEGYRIAG